MLDYEAFRPAVAALCQQLGVRRLDLFGSALTADFRPDSDVDVLVELDRSGGDLFNRYFDLKEQLEALVGRSVDLVMADAIKNPYFKAAVEAQHEQLYAA